MTDVYAIGTGEVHATYSCPPDQAVIAAHAQSLNDWNTWDYATKYKAFRGKHGYVCGNFWAKRG